MFETTFKTYAPKCQNPLEQKSNTNPNIENRSLPSFQKSQVRFRTGILIPFLRFQRYLTAWYYQVLIDWIEFLKSGDTDLSDVFDISKADIQGDANELLMEAFEKIAGKSIIFIK